MDIDSFPVPRIAEPGARSPSRTTSAGTKFKCVRCGKKTYRAIGRFAVCSYCTSFCKVRVTAEGYQKLVVRKDDDVKEYTMDCVSTL